VQGKDCLVRLGYAIALLGKNRYLKTRQTERKINGKKEGKKRGFPYKEYPS